MRSYKQICPVAKALDVIGDRWSLLIVRELLICGPSRYTDLRKALSGIATNLLAERLRELEDVGVVRSERAPPPVATTLYRLTERGLELEPVIEALGRWGAPLLMEASGDDEFRTHWLSLAMRVHCDRTVDGPPVTVEVRTGDEPMVIETTDGRIRTRAGPADHPDAVITGKPVLVVGVLTGRVDLASARKRGLRVEGDAEALRRVLPSARATVR